MKLGNIFKKEEKEEELNPRSLSGKMGLRFNRPAVPGGNRTGGAPFVPDFTPNAISWGTSPLTCPTLGAYTWRSGVRVQGINVPIQLMVLSYDASLSTTILGFCRVFYKVSSTLQSGGSGNTLPVGYTEINLLYITSQLYTDYIPLNPTLIDVNPGDYVSFAYQIIQPWTAGNVRQININNIARYTYTGNPQFISLGVQQVSYPSGCTWTPADSTPNPTPNFNNTSGSYS